MSTLALVNGKAQLVTQAIFGSVSAGWLRAAARQNVIAAVAQAGPHGHCMVADTLGHLWDAGEVAFGNNCVGINAVPTGWEVTWMRWDGAGAVIARVVLDDALRPLSAIQEFPSPFGHTADGFLDVAPGSVPVMTDQNRTQVKGSLTLMLPMTRSGVTIGQDRFGDRIIAWDARSNTAWEVSRISTQVPSHLVVEDDGTAVVVIGGTDVVVRQDKFEPWTPWVQVVPDEPKRPVPTLRKCKRKVTVYTFGAPGFRMSNEAVHDDESAPWQGAFVALGIPTTPVKLPEMAAIAHAHGVTLWEYYDGKGFPVHLIQMVPGVEVGVAVFGYPVNGDTLAERVEEIRASLKRVKEAGIKRIALVLPFYRQRFPAGPPDFGKCNWTLAQVMDLVDALVPNVVDEFGVSAVFCFHWDRGNGHDGITSRSELDDLHQQLNVSCQGSGESPAPDDPKPTPKPEPKPEPIPTPTPTPTPVPPSLPLRSFVMPDTQIVGLRVNGRMLSLPQGGTEFGFRDFDQPQGNEKAELSWPEGPDGPIMVRFIDADQVFSINNEGKIELRPAGTFGPHEQFRGGLLTPTTGVLFRAADVGLKAPIVEVVVWGGQS